MVFLLYVQSGLMLAKIAENSNFKGYRSKKKTESRVLKDQFEKNKAYFNTGVNNI
jgi:hypothetical protein